MAGSGRSWYYKRGEKKYGPVSTVQLQKAAQNGMLLPTDLLWREGMKVWAPASKLKGLSFGPPAVHAPSHDEPEPLSPRSGSSSASAQASLESEGDLLSMLPPPDPALLAMQAARDKPVVVDKPSPSPRRMYEQQFESSRSADIEPAGILRRYVALVLDSFAAGLISLLLYIPALILLEMLITTSAEEAREAALELGMLIAVNAVRVIYFIVADALPGGASPGKRMLGMTVVDTHGQPLSTGQALVRGVVKVIGLVLTIPLFVACFTSRKQAMHDLCVGSVVVRG